MNLFIAPFVNALFGLYYMVGNLGWAIILITILIRLLLLPLVFPSLKSANRMRDLQPKINKLKEKYGNQKEALAKAQMELYKQEGINPVAGCLPNILQIAVLIIFFQAFNVVSQFSEGKGSFEAINKLLVAPYQISQDFKFDLMFFGSNLTQTPAKLFEGGVVAQMILPFILLVGSGLLQYWSAKLMMPAPEVDKNVVKVTKNKEDDMMSMMRTQSTYLMPLMTIFLGWSFNLGMLLYWFVNSLVMIGQQLITNKLTVNSK